MRGIREVEVPRKGCRSRIQSAAARCILQALASSNLLSRRTGFAVIASLVLLALWTACNAKAEVQLQMLYECFGTNGGPTSPGTRLLEGKDGNFYGVSSFGGANDYGTVFRVTSSGVLSVVYSFDGTNGTTPSGGLVLGNDGLMYGVATYGRTNPPFCSIGFCNGNGTAFKITTNGVITRLTYFGDTNANPSGPLVLAPGGELYGVTSLGGAFGGGAVFRLTTNGFVTTLLSFYGTNGYQPLGGLILGDDGQLYGTTRAGGIGFVGGTSGLGTVFKLTTNGILTTLLYFDGTNGSRPVAGLTKGKDGYFYGTTYSNVFKMTSEGSLTNLVSFDGTQGWDLTGSVVEGSDGLMYGVTAYCCGPNYFTNYGTIYRVTTSGTLTTLTYLNGTNSMNPYANMILASDGNLYGTFNDIARQITLDGNKGAIFRLVRQPVVSVENLPNGSVKLTWDSFVNGRYRVDYRSSITASNWSVLATNVPSAGSVTAFTNNSPGATERYYRVVVVP